MLRRTIKLRQVEATAIGIVDGEVQTIKLRNFIYTGRKMSKTAIEKEYSADVEDCGLSQLVYEEKEIEEVYEITLEKFLANATLIENAEELGDIENEVE